MTQLLKTQDYQLKQEAGNITRYQKSELYQKKRILNYLFRYVAITTKREKIRAIPRIRYREMSNKLKLDFDLIHHVVSKFLVDLIRIKDCINKNDYVLYSKDQSRLVRSYLHKFHRLAPVFDYRRARENSRILKMKLDHLCFTPHITTQLAVIIYITDKLDHTKKDKILQTNLRPFCNCSAYAFHRTRNKLGMNK